MTVPAAVWVDQCSSDFAVERNIRMIRSCRDVESLQRLAIMLVQTNAALKALLGDSMLQEAQQRFNTTTNQSQQ